MYSVRRASATSDAQVVADPAEPLEVLVHQGLRLGRVDAQLLAQPEGAQPVRQPVVHRLDLGPLARRDLRPASTPNTRDAVTVWKSIPDLNASIRLGVLAGVRHDPHLDLASSRPTSATRSPAPTTNASPDPAALLGADRDVLQVRVGAGEPAGGGDRLHVRGVDPAVVGDRLEQALDGLPQPDRVPVDRAAGPGTGARSSRTAAAAPRRRWCSRSGCAGSSASRARRTAPPAAAWASRG